MKETVVVLRLHCRDNTTVFWGCRVFTFGNPALIARIHLDEVLKKEGMT